MEALDDMHLLTGPHCPVLRQSHPHSVAPGITLRTRVHVSSSLWWHSFHFNADETQEMSFLSLHTGEMVSGKWLERSMHNVASMKELTCHPTRQKFPSFLLYLPAPFALMVGCCQGAARQD